MCAFSITLFPLLVACVPILSSLQLFRGFPQRLARELCVRAPPGMRVRVAAPPDRIHSAWVGGSILTSLPSFASMWVTKAEYDEVGGNIAHRKCF